MAERKIKEIGTYEVKYNKQLRGRESEAFSYDLFKKNPKTKGVLLLFFLFYLLKKIKCLTWGVMVGKGEREEEEAGGGWGGWQGQ